MRKTKMSIRLMTRAETFWNRSNKYKQHLQNNLQQVMMKTRSSQRKPFGTAETNTKLFNHCLLLGRFYKYSCKCKNVRPSSIEHLNQVRCNLKKENTF